MAWADGKAAIATRLATVAITTPEAITTELVRQTPPATLMDRVSWVLFSPRVRVSRFPGGWRDHQYRYRARLFVYDANHQYAALVLENLLEATVAKFDDQSALRTGGVQHINGPDIDEPGTLVLGGRLYHIGDCFFDIELGEAKTFG